jgi:hypothetical protein
MLDLLIRNARIGDGTGAVHDGVIRSIGKGNGQRASTSRPFPTTS